MCNSQVRFAALLLFFASSGVAADEIPISVVPSTFDSAAAHYKSGDFAIARQEFLELAKAGIWVAYVNLGVMALNGQGISADPGQALGWFKSAEELGQKVPGDWATKLEQSLTTLQRETAAKTIAEYGKEATLERLMNILNLCSSERVSRDEEVPSIDVVLIKYPKKITYPKVAAQSRVQGLLQVTAIVDADGYPKDVRIEFLMPQDQDLGFVTAAMDAFQNYQFRPASKNGKFMPQRVRQRFNFGHHGATGEFWEEAPLKKLKSAAQMGNVNAQHLIASLARIDPDVAKMVDMKCKERMRMDLSAAVGGIDDAQYWLSVQLSLAEDPRGKRMSDAWLRNAATSSARAQLLLINRLMRRSDAQQRVREIRELLLRAATSNDEYVRKHVAFILGTTKLLEVRNPSAALSLAKQLKPVIDSSPEVEIVLAAAQAASSDYLAAVEIQIKAITKAERLSWDTQKLRELLMAYQANQMPDFSGLYLSDAYSLN